MLNWRTELPGNGLLGTTMVEVLDGAGDVYATGRLIAVTDQPTMVIEMDDGRRVSWIVGLGWRPIADADSAPRIVNGTCPTCLRPAQDLSLYYDRSRHYERLGCVDQRGCCDAFSRLQA